LLFQDIIKHTFNSNTPQVSKQYELKSGKLELNPIDLENYQKLFRPANVSKDVGNGEVGLFWLFNKEYGGIYDVSENRGEGRPDLKIGNKLLEVKAYKRIRAPLLIGRIESNYEVRKYIKFAVGCYNCFKADRNDNIDFLSDMYLTVRDLTRAMEVALDVEKSFFQHSWFVDCKEAVDYTAKIFALLAEEKLKEKPGEGNFIINTNPDKIDEIKIFQVKNVNEMNLDVIKKNGAILTSTGLRLKLAALE
jgi:hypothetical protein